MSKLHLIGLMSGTSMDGVDLAFTSFDLSTSKNDQYNLIHAKTYEFEPELRKKLIESHEYSLHAMCMLDKELGLFLAKCINTFIDEFKIDHDQIDAIASHGQTILHQPQNGYTLQIGCGSTIAYHTGIKVINDFRTRDVIAKGQGAPLVPIGDFGLFHQFASAFLNIGGFCNISFKKDDQILAYDICPGNLPLDKLVKIKDLTFDRDGALASSGEINFFLLDLLNNLPYYTQLGPKSLGTEWLEEHFFPMLKFDKEIENNLRTVVEHIAIQITQTLNDNKIESVCITGGGAKNKFLVSRIKHYYQGDVIIPDNQTVEFKEAIIFAYLGALYLKNRPNVHHSVTGAEKSVTTGVLHIPC